MPYAKTPPRVPSAVEQAKILKVTGEHVDGYRDHMLFSIALASALREHEVAALNVGSVVHGGKIRSRLQLETYKGRSATKKAAKSQYVFLSRTVRTKLAQFLKWKQKRGEPVAPEDPLFVTKWAPFIRLSKRSIRDVCHRWQRTAGIDPPYNFHAFRHACLTNLYRATKDPRLVQKVARHSNLSNTEIYMHVSDEDVSNAMNQILS